MSTRYRVYIGEAAQSSVTLLAMEWFQSATITRGRGIWEGTAEDVTVVEVIGIDQSTNKAEVTHARDTLHAKVTAFALVARDRFKQDCVLIVKDEPDARLV